MNFDEWYNGTQPIVMTQQPMALQNALRELARKAWDAAIRAAEAELEKAFAEADTLNLLHGAARVRALSSNAPLYGVIPDFAVVPNAELRGAVPRSGESP